MCTHMDRSTHCHGVRQMRKDPCKQTIGKKGVPNWTRSSRVQTNWIGFSQCTWPKTFVLFLAVRAGFLPILRLSPPFCG